MGDLPRGDAYNQKIYAGRTGSMRKWKLLVLMYRGAEGAGSLKGRYAANTLTLGVTSASLRWRAHHI